MTMIFRQAAQLPFDIFGLQAQGLLQRPAQCQGTHGLGAGNRVMTALGATPDFGDDFPLQSQGDFQAVATASDPKRPAVGIEQASHMEALSGIQIDISVGNSK
jgi:hypothetical protein